MNAFRSYSSMSSVVRALLIINGGMFLLELYSSGQLINTLALWPLGLSGTAVLDNSASHFQLWQLVTYSFLHGGVMHLLLNMCALWLFGSRMEKAWGSKAFTFYYFVCVLGADAARFLETLSGYLSSPESMDTETTDKNEP